MTIFLTSEGDVLEIGKYNESGNPFLKHEIPEPIVKIGLDYSPSMLYLLLGMCFPGGTTNQTNLDFLEERTMSNLLK